MTLALATSVGTSLVETRTASEAYRCWLHLTLESLARKSGDCSTTSPHPISECESGWPFPIPIIYPTGHSTRCADVACRPCVLGAYRAASPQPSPAAALR